jgi:uncharacterized coiled-coil protein SlyX
MIMNAAVADPVARLEQRLLHLEEAYMFLQRTVQELDGVVLHVQRRLDALESRIGQLDGRLAGFLEPDAVAQSDDSTAAGPYGAVGASEAERR